MRHVGDAVLHLREREHQLQDDGRHHQVLRLHRNDEEHEQVPVGKVHGVRQQDRVHGARRPHDGGGGKRADRQAAQAGAHAGDQVERHKPAPSEDALDLRPEHPQDEHVEHDVQELGTVQEHVGDQAPDLSAQRHRHRDQAHPEIEPVKMQGAVECLPQVDRDVEDEQRLDHGGQGRADGDAGLVGVAHGLSLYPNGPRRDK